MLRVFLVVAGVVLIVGVSFAGADTGASKEVSVYDRIAEHIAPKDGVKEISYDEFLRIRNSGQPYVLLDVLSLGSFRDGHIPGSRSFPLGRINKKRAQEMLSQDDRIIVYCASFSCTASTTSAQKLSEYGYSVLDYKGGLKEWQEKGNDLVSAESQPADKSEQ